MRIHKFNNATPEDLKTTVFEEVASPERKLGIENTYFHPCLAGKIKRSEEPQKQVIRHIHNGIWHQGWSVVGLLLALCIHPAGANAGAPTDQLKQSVEKLQAILSDKSLKGEAKLQERRQKLREVIDARFDFDEMAKRSLGPEWQKHSPEEQKDFVAAFTGLLEAAYFDKLESYNGEKVRFINERKDEDITQVDTKITDNKGQDYSVNYRLRDVNGDWKVFDVVIENISLVNNYRSQFSRVLAKSSYQDLVQAMNQKKFGAVSAKN